MDTDKLSMAERSRRVVEIKTWLDRQPGAPDELKVSPLRELGWLLYSLEDYDDALELRQNIELPLHRRLNDSRAVAITQVYIADILGKRGNREEALRILREEVCPAFAHVGDVRSRAVAVGRIADILQQRGDNEEALRIHREEQLPIYEQLGDVRSRAMAMGNIADILQQRGESEEALRILREDVSPIFAGVGDVRSRAITMGVIADNLQQSAHSEEALRIPNDEVLPAAESIEDMDLIASTLYKSAILRLHLDGLENHKDAQTIVESLRKCFELNCQLGRVNRIASVGSLFGQLLANQGLVGEAIPVLEKAAAVFEELQELEQAAKLRELVNKVQEKV
jgi:tetratricopeptide (TPR) repeat protein